MNFQKGKIPHPVTHGTHHSSPLSILPHRRALAPDPHRNPRPSTSSPPAAMAETVDKGSPSYAVATVPAFEEEADEDRCVRILATFGLDLSRAVDPDSAALAAVPAFEEETDEDRCVRILATFGLDLSRSSTPTPLHQLCRLGRIWSGPRRLLYFTWLAWPGRRPSTSSLEE